MSERKKMLNPNNFIPNGDVVLVKPEKPDFLHASGLELPKNSVDIENPNIGIIVAVGPGKVTNGIPMDVFLKLVNILAPKPDADKIITEIQKLQGRSFQVGDQVIYGKYAGTQLKIGEDDYLSMRANDILLTVEKEEE